METPKFIDVWSAMYLFDLFRYLIPASLAFLIFWVIGKNRWRHLFIQTVFPKPSQFWKEFAYSMSTVVIFSLVGFGLYTAKKAGYTMIYDSIDEYGAAYLLLSFVLTLIFHDFYFYWTHRLMHHKSIFKYVHRVHHESVNPSPWAAYSFHPWEAFIQALVLPIMAFAFPLHDLTIFLFLIYMILRNVLGHLGFEILPKGFTHNKWFNWNTSITHHNLHHKDFRYNYGLYFSWWDNIMQTTHDKYHETFDEVKSRPKSCSLKSNVKKSVIQSIIFFFLIPLVKAQSVSGTWMTYNEESGSALSVVEIKEIANSIEGKVVKIFLEPYQGEDPVCSKCTGTRKDQKVIGMNFLWGFKKENGSWPSGKILDPESGEMYSSKLWLEDKNTLKVRGYGGPLGLFYRTQTWKRDRLSIDETPEGLWRTIDDRWNRTKSLVEIKNEKGELHGYIRKIFLLPHEGTDPVCTECTGDLKNVKIIGMKIIWGFRKEGNKWEDGEVLDPGNGNTYSSALWLIDSDTLKVRGYYGPFFRSQVWKRVTRI